MLVTSNATTHRLASSETTLEPRARDRLIEAHTELASALARRFIGRGEEFDDLRQVALLALVGAASRFDPTLGYAFSTFATPTIVGGLKRHLRDHTWAIRPPRSLQERYLEVNATRDALIGDLHRVPETGEIAERGNWTEQQVRDALAERVHRRFERGNDDDRPERGAIEPGFGRVEDRHVVDELLEEVGARERSIVEMRFFGEMSQANIGERVGVSQMQICRLLQVSLVAMRRAAVRKEVT